MRTLCLNLDLTDAEILRDAVRLHLAALPEPADLRVVDEQRASLMGTLDQLTTMINRPAPVRLGLRDVTHRHSGVGLRRVR